MSDTLPLYTHINPCICYCHGEGNVTFRKCKTCKTVYGKCDEVETNLYPIQPLTESNVKTTKCPACNEENDFWTSIPATKKELLELGLDPLHIGVIEDIELSELE